MPNTGPCSGHRNKLYGLSFLVYGRLPLATSAGRNPTLHSTRKPKKHGQIICIRHWRNRLAGAESPYVFAGLGRENEQYRRGYSHYSGPPRHQRRPAANQRSAARIRQHPGGFADETNSGFFGTEIKTLNRAIGGNATIADTYVFELQGVQQEKFRDYINYEGLDGPSKAFASLLFSEENLETKMDIGFVGNPNIGSTVLNQFRYSDVFQAFAENFGANDRIFIVSSIFGGTGAAGFPILLKNIRGAQAIGQIPNPAFLTQCQNRSGIGYAVFQPDHQREQTD